MLFVTALFFPESELSYRKKSEYLRLGRFLVQATVPLRVYTSPASEGALRESWEGLDTSHVDVCTDVAVESHWRRDDVALPRCRSPEKDTAYYLCVQMSKLKCLAHASQHSTHLAWIDYGIFHMIKDVSSTQDILRAVAGLLPQRQLPKILSPAGHLFPVDVWHVPRWSFLGSVLFGRSRAFAEAYRRQTELVLENLPKLTWEINYWTLMPEHFEGYPSGHDDGIVSGALEALRALPIATADDFT
jgi:hypothetical protein